RIPRKMRLRNTFAELHMVPAPILVGCRQFPPAPPRAPKKRCPQPSFPSSRGLEDHPPDVWRPAPPAARPANLPAGGRGVWTARGVPFSTSGGRGRPTPARRSAKKDRSRPRPHGDRQKRTSGGRGCTTLPERLAAHLFCPKEGDVPFWLKV